MNLPGRHFALLALLGPLLVVTGTAAPDPKPSENHWSFKALVRPAPPEVDPTSWRRNTIDDFILARLQGTGLTPSPQADRRTLIRRLSLDITGLPPTPAEVSAFLDDTSPRALEQLIDQLLASPAYGEKWASKWLDQARYADTNGYEADHHRHMWAFRDWVIKALNADMPYDQFTLEQIAGDLLPNSTHDQRIATAFHRNTMTNVEGGTDDEEFRSAAVVDRVNTTLQVWMGLTAACAACHSHKYDPLSQREYYQLFAVFNQTQDHDQNDNRPTLVTPTSEQESRLSLMDSRLNALQTEKGNPDQIKSLKDEIAKLRKSLPRTPIMAERPRDKHRVTKIHRRGNFRDQGDTVTAAVPAAFHGLPDDVNPATLNRLGLARWLVDQRNPLTARVAVNRIWEELFGTGLVTTSEDFGTQGEPPSHPDLLDYLACRFMDQGWSRKALIKSILMSATYLQTSQITPDQWNKDPENRLLSRGPSFRLSAELIRDQALAVSGLLSRKMYGPSVMPPQPAGLWKEAFSRESWKNSSGEDRYRRGLYTYWKRTSPYPSMVAFDSTSREVCTVRRIRTNTPLSALVTMNDLVYLECAQGLARRILRESPENTTAQFRAKQAFEWVLIRPPNSRELQSVLELFQAERASLKDDPAAAGKVAGNLAGTTFEKNDIPELAAWTLVSRVLLNLDETLTKR